MIVCFKKAMVWVTSEWKWFSLFYYKCKMCAMIFSCIFLQQKLNFSFSRDSNRFHFVFRLFRRILLKKIPTIKEERSKILLKKWWWIKKRNKNPSTQRLRTFRFLKNYFVSSITKKCVWRESYKNSLEITATLDNIMFA